MRSVKTKLNSYTLCITIALGHYTTLKQKMPTTTSEMFAFIHLTWLYHLQLNFFQFVIKMLFPYGKTTLLSAGLDHEFIRNSVSHVWLSGTHLLPQGMCMWSCTDGLWTGQTPFAQFPCRIFAGSALQNSVTDFYINPTKWRSRIGTRFTCT